MNRPVVAYCAVLLCTLSPLPRAQHPFVGSPPREIPWNSAVISSGETFAASLAGDFNGDLHVDVLSLSSDQPVFLFGPGSYSSMMEHSVTCHHAAVAQEPTSQEISLLLTTSTGLVRSWYSSLDRDFLWSPVASGPEWVDARRVVIQEPATGPGVDALGVSSDGLKVLFISDVLGSATMGSDLRLSSEILDLASVQWSGGSRPETAVLTKQSLQVFSGGLMVDSHPVLFDSGRILRFRQEGFSHDRVVLIGKNRSLPDSLLYVVDHLGMEAPVSTGMDIVGSVMGDVDGDGDDDLLLSTTGETVLRYLPNNSNGNPPAGGPTFAAVPGATVDLGHGSAPATQRSGDPLLEDLDGDGDLDLLLTLPEHGQYLLLPNQSRSVSDHQVIVEGSRYDHDPLLGVGDLELDLGSPLDLLPGATHLEVVTWRRADLASAVNPLSVARTLHPFAGSWPWKVHESTFEPTMHTLAIYYFQLRLVTLDPTGRMVAAAPIQTLAFSTDADTTDQLEQDSGVSVIPVELDPIWKDDSDLGSGLNTFLDPGEYQEDPPNPLAATASTQ